MRGEVGLNCLMIYLISYIHWSNGQGNVPGLDGGTGPSQIDLEAEKIITVCTTQRKPLSCGSPGSTIAVNNVFWGRKRADVCPSDDGDTQLDCDTAPETEGIVKNFCEGKESCELEARHTSMQKKGSVHCPGVNKYLIVNYTCVPDAKEVTICDSENTTLNCPAKWKVDVNSVFWGRQSVGVCPDTERGQTMCTGAPESLTIVKKYCDGFERCDMQATPTVVQNGGAENCPNVNKYLIVNYSCRPHPGIGTEEPDEPDLPIFQNSEPEENKQDLPIHNKQNHGVQPEQNVAGVLKQLENDQDGAKVPVQNEKESAAAVDVNFGKLGMGGLKALEKINNLIKASAEAQGGDASMIENGLTDDQAQEIERMIIEGIQNIKRKPHIKQANIAKLRAAVAKQKMKQKSEEDKPTQRSTLADRPNILKMKVLKGQGQQNHSLNNFQTQPKLRKGPKMNPIVNYNAVKSQVTGNKLNLADKQTLFGKERPPAIPVLRNYNQQGLHAQEKKANKVKFGVGNAGAGNMP